VDVILVRRHGVQSVADLRDKDRPTDFAPLLLGAVLPVGDDLLGGDTLLDGAVGSVNTASDVVNHFLSGLAIGQVALNFAIFALILLLAGVSVKEQDQLLADHLLGGLDVEGLGLAFELHF